MNVALALQYFPTDADPVTVHVSTDLQLIRAFGRAVLREARERCQAVRSDPVAALIEEAEEQRLVAVLGLVGAEENWG